MATKKGFFKSCMFGCLGILVFGFLFAGISALLAWRSVGDQARAARCPPRKL